ncbi:hypothetical protein NDU88_005687 [Pleurodeles waltl]|uniref:Myb-like domain-containing protein n=1 Tax=Pleurodeles waltl TaxID=8319 RepID=A0AAV7WBD2_PLEWA|nr:hypothetical protein NDU88_005687 [Pleurodeles waltl]
MSQRTVPMKDNSEHRVKQLRGTYPQFTQNTIHTQKVACMCVECRPRSAPPKKKHVWHAIAKDVRALGVYHGRSTHCRKRWEDIRHWSKKTAEAQVGMASQRGRGAWSHHDPPDVQDPGGGLPGVGWALEGITAATRGSRTSTSATTCPGPVVPVVTGIWSAPATRAASVARSHSIDSPPPVKHQKLASAQRDRGKTPATKAAPRGPGGSVDSAVTPSKVGKGHKKLGKSGKSSTAEKSAIIPAAQEATSSTSPAAQDRTTSTSPAAQDRTACILPAAQDRTTSTSPAAQERTSSTSPAAQAGPPAQAHLPRRPPPAKAPLGHEGPPAA